jgi:purine-cytosine permease-like protein
MTTIPTRRAPRWAQTTVRALLAAVVVLAVVFGPAALERLGWFAVVAAAGALSLLFFHLDRRQSAPRYRRRRS